MSDASSPPRTEADLRFERKRMVGWFDPRQLLSTGARAVMSELFGAYFDRRELQAALRTAGDPPNYANDNELWIDFVADLGDGFDSTYTIAYLLSRPSLPIGSAADGTRHGTPDVAPRGRILVMGGDQVYPVARRDEYQNRLHGPYEAALPSVPDGTPSPHLFAIPGNHDWYDGLTSFLRTFCQERHIGAWQTRQSRSYFALQLPHRWWLWGTDMQLESDIDRPQLDFFTQLCKTHLKPGDRVILCTAQPAWVQVAAGREEAYHNLSFLEQTLIERYGATLAVTLTGDLHHYARYESTDASGKQKITAGGGGAYLAGTHDLPEALTLPKGEGTETYRRAGVYPSPGRSRVLSFGALAFLAHNRGFAVLLGGLYLLYAWLFQSASRREASAAAAASPLGASFLDALSTMPFSEWRTVAWAVWRLLVHNPGVVAAVLAIVAGLAAFTMPERPGRWRRVAARAAGAVHGLAHLSLNVALIWAFARINVGQLGLTVATARQSLLFSAEMLVVGSALGGVLMGLYLVLANQLLGLHRNDVFAAQSIPDYKNFLRLWVRPDGGLTILTYGIDRVCRRWKVEPEAGGAWVVPRDGEIVVKVIDRVEVPATPPRS